MGSRHQFLHQRSRSPRPTRTPRARAEKYRYGHATRVGPVDHAAGEVYGLDALVHLHERTSCRLFALCANA